MDADVPPAEEHPHLEATLDDDGLLHVAGELDSATADRLLEAGRAAIAAGAATLRVDVSGLRFIDSGGLRSLVLLSREVEGPLVLAGASDMLVRLLEVTGLSDAFALV